MSWFEYGQPERRHWRKGVWLRVRSLDQELLGEAQQFLREGEEIVWVIVDELQPEGMVLLEFWSVNALENMARFNNGHARYNVFHIRAKENPQWVCEGDMGRGMVEMRKTENA